MSEAFRCDGCRAFFSGSPAFTGSAQGRTVSRRVEGEATTYLYPSHNGGVNDYNPVGGADLEVEWPAALLQSHSFVLCADCFTEGLLPAVHDVIHEKEETS